MLVSRIKPGGIDLQQTSTMGGVVVDALAQRLLLLPASDPKAPYDLPQPIALTPLQ